MTGRASSVQAGVAVANASDRLRYAAAMSGVPGSMRPLAVVGTAGWTIPRAAAAAFVGDGSHLQRYARVLTGVEINSSFYRRHAAAVYARWASSTPPHFRFSVKLPRAITHDAALGRPRLALVAFLQDVTALGDKLGPLLVQLPPSQAFDPRVARRFFDTLRACHDGAIVCEPRHPSWFDVQATALLVRVRVSRAAADPSSIVAAAQPGGWTGEPADGASRPVIYHRLHGSPRMYWSRYPPERIDRWAAEIADLPAGGDVWCMFDNTATGSAIENALEMQQALSARRPITPPGRSSP